MRIAKQSERRRPAFTLVELIVVIGIILLIAALAAAFAPRVNENTTLSRSVDTVEQTLLTAKVRAKRDQLATGVRFVQDASDPALIFSQMQYIQQPDPLCGGWLSTTNSTGSVLVTGTVPPQFVTGGILLNAGFTPPGATPPVPSPGTVNFGGNIDFTLGFPAAQSNQWLVQPGDLLEIRDAGVYQIGTVTGPTSLQLGQLGSTSTSAYYHIPWPNPMAPVLFMSDYENSLSIATATTNYRILRQPRILVGEPPVALPNNFAVDLSKANNVNLGFSGSPEILFSPAGSVIGTNAGSGKILMIVRDTTEVTGDVNMMGIVAVQSRTGFIGAYSVAPGADPFAFVSAGRTSGL